MAPQQILSINGQTNKTVKSIAQTTTNWTRKLKSWQKEVGDIKTIITFRFFFVTPGYVISKTEFFFFFYYYYFWVKSLLGHIATVSVLTQSPVAANMGQVNGL